MTPADWRARFRGGERRLTAGLCPGFVQANMAFVPADAADEFEAFLDANPTACPKLARGLPGEPSLSGLGDFDLRHDLPLYRLFRDGASTELVPDLAGHWRDDLVPFAIGCSLSFEADLVAAGVSLRCHAPGQSCSAFDTTIPNRAAGRFGGNLVVSMRAIRPDLVPLAVAVTRSHPDAHGEPVHIGDPAAIGVDLGRPIDGLGLTDIGADEVAVFWACGVTMERAITSAGLPFAVTHAPGHMLITDLRAGGLP